MPEPTRASPAALVALPIVAAAISAAALTQLLLYPYGRDQSTFSLVGLTLLQGGVPYVDAWDYKTPGVYLVYALAHLVPAGMVSVRLLEAAALLSLLPAFAWLSRHHLGDPRPGLLGFAFSVMAYVPLGFWHTAQAETFGGVLVAWALVAASNPGPRAAALVGVLYGVAAVMKPPLAVALPVGLLLAAHRERSAVPLLAGSFGFVLPLVLTLAALAAVGALDEAWWTLGVFAPEHVAMSRNDASLPAHLATAVSDWALRIGPLPTLGILAHAAYRPSGRERDGLLHTAAVALVLLVGVAVQARFFRYHYAPVILVAGLPAGWGAWRVWVAAQRRQATAGAALLALGVLLAALPVHLDFWRDSALRLEALGRPDLAASIRADLYDLAADRNPGKKLAIYSRARNEEAGRFVAANTSPSDPVYVWGFEPGIYEIAGRRPSSRWIYNEPQRTRWSRDRTRAELLADLAARPPAAVVVQHGDVFPFITGAPTDSAAELDGFPELRALVHTDFRPAARFGHLQVWLRR